MFKIGITNTAFHKTWNTRYFYFYNWLLGTFLLRRTTWQNVVCIWKQNLGCAYLKRIPVIPSEFHIGPFKGQEMIVASDNLKYQQIIYYDVFNMTFITSFQWTRRSTTFTSIYISLWVITTIRTTSGTQTAFRCSMSYISISH